MWDNERFLLTRLDTVQRVPSAMEISHSIKEVRLDSFNSTLCNQECIFRKENRLRRKMEEVGIMAGKNLMHWVFMT